MFYGRQHELKLIRDAIASKQPELGIVYGRRRVGKSELLAQAGGGKNDLYFEGLQQASLKDQLDHFVSQLATQTKTPKAVAGNWRAAFEVLAHYLKRGRRYVVFDEFPWMAAGRTELVALVKYFWDNHWKKNPGITLVLCGSIAQFMTRHIVHSQALHNRKTFELKLDPFSAHDAQKFFGGYRSDFEIARFLMVFGGIPKYLEQVDPTRSLAENLDRLCFRKNAFFVTEFDSIFKEQFKVARTYERIVRTLADGSCSKEALAGRLKMKPGGGLTGYLNNLDQADFVRVFSPVSVRGAGEKTRRVVLWDEWLRFYFQYVEPNRAAIQVNTRRGLFEKLAARSFDSWCGLAFEQLCMKNLPSILAHLGIDPSNVVDYGPFFRQPTRNKPQRDGLQIDILVHRRGDVLTLIECKFRTQPVGVSVIDEVERKIKLLKAPRRFTVERILLCAGELTRDLKRRTSFHRVLGLDAVFAPPDLA